MEQLFWPPISVVAIIIKYLTIKFAHKQQQEPNVPVSFYSEILCYFRVTRHTVARNTTPPTSWRIPETSKKNTFHFLWISIVLVTT